MHFGVCPGGWVGVQFFYVLSGYLITRILRSARDSQTQVGPYLMAFVKRRMQRIVPLYCLCLVVAITVAYFFHSPKGDLFRVPALLTLSTYTYNVYRALAMPGLHESLVPHLWSISVEEQFYLLWPLLIFFVPGRWLSRLAVLFFCMAPLLRFLCVHWVRRVDPNLAIYFLTPFQVDGFALGGLIAVMPTGLYPGAKKAIAGALAVLGLGVWICHLRGFHWGQAWPPQGLVSVWSYTAIDLFGAFLVLECLTGGPSLRALELVPLRWLGKVSYGFYIWHVLCLLVFERLVLHSANVTPPKLLFFPYVLFVSGVAAISFYGFEKRFLQKHSPKVCHSMSSEAMA